MARTMSLVTRCPACGTMFKVVADQLRVSQGWVRCGSCSDVFDANASMQNDRLAVDEKQRETSKAPDAAGEHFVDHVTPELNPANGKEKVLAEPLAADTVVKHPDESVPSKQGNADAPVGVDEQLDAKTSVLTRADVATTQSEQLSVGDVAGQPDFQHVSFVRKARREAFWQQAFLRLGLAVLSGVLVALLGIQWIVQYKDQIAETQPWSLPVLQAACASLKCSIKPLRRIDSVLIDSTSFTKLDNASFRLSFVLKNTANVPLEAPLLELTLNDNQDRAVLRRVLTPAQFGVETGALLAARSETGGVVNLTVASDEGVDSRVSAAMVVGYRVLIFYP